jgi:hypothetical protein
MEMHTHEIPHLRRPVPMNDDPYQPRQFEEPLVDHRQSSPATNPMRDLLRLMYLVTAGTIFGCFVAAEIWYELLMKLSLGPQLGQMAMLLLFLVAMVGGGVAGGWLAKMRSLGASPDPDPRIDRRYPGREFRASKRILYSMQRQKTSRRLVR